MTALSIGLGRHINDFILCVGLAASKQKERRCSVMATPRFSAGLASPFRNHWLLFTKATRNIEVRYQRRRNLHFHSKYDDKVIANISPDLSPARNSRRSNAKDLILSPPSNLSISHTVGPGPGQ